MLIKFVSTMSTKGLSVLIVLYSQWFLAQQLKTEDYGIFAFVQVLIVGVALFGQGGLQTTITKYGAIFYSEEEGKHLKDLWGYSFKRIVLLIVPSILVFLGALYFSDLLVLLGNHLILTLCVLVFFVLGVQVLIGWYRAADKAYIASMLEQGAYIGLMTAVLTFMVWEGQLLDLTKVFNTFLFSVVLIFSIALFHPYLKSRNLEISKARNNISMDQQFNSYSNRVWLLALSSYALTWGGVLISGIFLSSTETAMVNVAQRIAQVMTFFLLSLNGVVASKFAVANSSESIGLLKIKAQQSTVLLVAFTFPIAMLLLVFGSDILRLFGDNYVNAYPVLVVLLLAQCVNVSVGPVGFLMTMSGQESVVVKVVVISGVISVFASWIGAINWGATGLAVGLSLGLVVKNVYLFVKVRELYGFSMIPGRSDITKYLTNDFQKR